MWDEIYAEVAGDVTGSVSKKDEAGVTHTLTPAVAPAGDVTNRDKWVKACKGGASIADKGKTEDGASASIKVKELSGKLATKAAERLFGMVKVKPRTGAADTIPSENGATV